MAGTSDGPDREAGAAEVRAPGDRSAANRRIRRTIKIVLFLIVFNYIGLPALAGVPKAVDQLTEVQPLYLALGVGLEIAALLAYTQLMKVTLPRRSVGLFRLFRIQLATKSITNTVPGGTAASAALGYRLLTTSSVDGPDAGFALAATGLVSACVLNLLLWVALLLSIPFYGVSYGYAIAAILGAIVILFAAGLVLALVRGRERAKRILHALTSHLRFIKPERVTEIIEQVAGRLGEIIGDRELVQRAALWASLNWLLDAASLWVFVRAFGETPNVVGLLVAFGLANVLAVIPITPGGLGIVEGTIVGTLTGFGVARAAAGLGVGAYRLAAFWIPIPLGGVAYLTVRRDQRPGRLRDVARAAYESPESLIDWAEEYGHRPPPHVDPRSEPNDAHDNE